MTPTLIYIILGIIIAVVFGLAAYEYSDKKKAVNSLSKTIEVINADMSLTIDTLVNDKFKLEESYEEKIIDLQEEYARDLDSAIDAITKNHNEELGELRDLHIKSIEKMSKDYVETIEEQNEALGLYEKYMMQLDYTIEYTSKVIKELDIRGAYESDDELGIFFKAVKEMQGYLEKFKLEKSEQDQEIKQ